MTISSLSKSFGQFSLHIPHLQMPADQIYGLIGPNGCGKSTLASLLAGLLPPDSGTINHDGLGQKDMTLVPQKPYLMRDTVLANLIYPLKVRKLKPNAAEIDHYLKLAGLQNLRHEYAPKLSSGEAQKLALIRAMVFSPRLIFVDETFSNMDMESQANFENYILESQQKRPITWVIISHQLSTIKRICDYVFYMKDGRIEEEGKACAIFANPKTASLKRYLAFMGN